MIVVLLFLFAERLDGSALSLLGIEGFEPLPTNGQELR